MSLKSYLIPIMRENSKLIVFRATAKLIRLTKSEHPVRQKLCLYTKTRPKLGAQNAK